MHKQTRWLVLAAFALLAVGAWPAAAAPDGTYAVRLSRSQKVGDRYAVALKGRQHKVDRVTMGPRIITDTDTTVDVEGLAAAEVQAVDGKRQATRVAYTIERLVKIVNGSTSDVLGPGRVVVVESRGGRTRFMVDGEQPPKEIAEVLGIIISAHDPDSGTDDEIFGTKDRKRIGDEWAINAAAAARDFTAKGMKLDPTSIVGSTKLVDARAHDGIKVLELTGRVRITNLNLPVPAGAQVDKASIEARFWGLVPQDPASSRRVAESMQLRTAFTVRTKKPDTGEEILVQALIEQGHEARYKPLGP